MFTISSPTCFGGQLPSSGTNTLNLYSDTSANEDNLFRNHIR